MLNSLTQLDAFRATAALVSMGMAISSLEFLDLRVHFRRGGLYAWHALKMRHQLDRDDIASKLFSYIFESNAFLAILVLRLFAALIIFILSFTGTIWFSSLLIATITQFLFTYRNSIGGDGSDQMTSVVTISLFCYALRPGNQIVGAACLWFLALQSLLAYSASGVAKLYSKKWRRGTALFEIMNTKTYGLKHVAAFLRQHDGLSRFASYSVMAGQLSFFLVFVLPWPWNVIYIIWGVGFHLGIAMLMGLNVFPFPFIACYPAVLYCASLLHWRLP